MNIQRYWNSCISKHHVTKFCAANQVIHVGNHANHSCHPLLLTLTATTETTSLSIISATTVTALVANSTQDRSIMAEFTQSNITAPVINGVITVPYLNKNNQPKVNFLHGSPINVKTIPASSSTPSTKGKFQKVKGLDFDTAFLHFEPTKWNYSIWKDVDSDIELVQTRFWAF